MVTVGLYYDVIPEKAPLFTAKFQELLELMRNISGHKESYLYHRVDDPYSYAIISEWEDPQSFQDFVRSETFRQVTSWGRQEILRHPPRHKIYPRAEDLGRPSA